jgi:predicted double-glycine peptidase
MTARWVVFSCLSLGLVTGPSVLAADVSFIVGSERFTKHVTSLYELRRQNVVMQALDFSCGAAALATVLRYGFADTVTESELIGYIFVFGQTPTEGYKKYFKRQGFTLLDLKRAARARGYQGTGYKGMTLDELLEFIEGERTPVLVPIRPMGYNHFVVVRGVAGNRILLADPAKGNTTMTLTHFLDVWIDGIGFIVKPRELASAGPEWETGHRASDQEMDQLTAAGPAPDSPGAQDAPSRTLLSARRTDPPLSLWRLQSFLQAEIPRETLQLNRITIQNQDGLNIFTMFNVQHYNGGLQLGLPAGNFADFTPKSGVLTTN